MAAPAGRFSVAFDDPTLKWDVSWTALDQEHPSLVTSYLIDRGRQYELDRTDTGRALVQLADRDGLLDPTNPDGPYYGKLEPLLQAAIARWNPVAGEWDVRFRGFIEDFDYEFDPSQRVNRLTVTLVDLFEILAAIEMLPGQFGDPPPEDAADQIFFDNAQMQTRIVQALGNVGGGSAPGIPPEYFVRTVFTGNVLLHETWYSPGETLRTVIDEAVDGEFPGVGNAYVDRFGRLAVHGRGAKFDPADVLAGLGTDYDWDFHHWKAGDGAKVAENPAQYAHIRRFAYNRGLAKVINSATATPLRRQVPLTEAEAKAQVVTDTVSMGRYGVRSWSAQNLLTHSGFIDGTTDLVETRRFAEYYVANYKLPHNRVTEIAFRTMRPGAPGSSENWRLLSKVDISDQIDLWVGSPGGGGFDGEEFYVEGIHEQARAATPDYDDVTVSLDLSPRAVFAIDPWA